MGMCLTQVIALTAARWGSPPGLRGTPRPASANGGRGLRAYDRNHLSQAHTQLELFTRASRVSIVPLQMRGLRVKLRWSFDRNFHRCVRDHTGAHLE